MSTEAKFVDGMRVYAPRDNAPDFVKANLVINIAELQAWLAQRSGEVRIDIKESRNGKLYASENDYKSSGKPEAQAKPRQQAKEPAGDASGGFDDDIPFAPLGKRCHWVA
jgi:hypothetical protein